MSDTEKILARLDALLDRIGYLIPLVANGITEFDGGAYRWQSDKGRGQFYKINRSASIKLDDLRCIDHQKRKIEQNTQQFLANLPANHVLLWGPKGTGKSSLIKAFLNEYQEHHLSLIEVERTALGALTNIIEQLHDKAGHFILYCDDLSFETKDSDYKTIKVALDGSLSDIPDNILIYATSNRRHLIPESMHDNLASQNIQGELHLSEAIEEKLTLSERFGISLAFHPFSQEQYLEIVGYWLPKLGYVRENLDPIHKASLKWALEHGSRSGRSAWQFSRDWVGQHQLKKKL